MPLRPQSLIKVMWLYIHFDLFVFIKNMINAPGFPEVGNLKLDSIHPFKSAIFFPEPGLQNGVHPFRRGGPPLCV